MAYLYLEPYLLNKMINDGKLFTNVIHESFKQFILQDDEKKRLIFDLKNILKSYQKFAHLELNLFTKYRRNSEEFFFNIVTIFHVKKRYFSFNQLHEFYLSHFVYTFDMQEKEENFKKILSMYSNFSNYELNKIFPFNYSAMFLEIPHFVYDEFCCTFNREEIENLSYSFWHEMNDLYLLDIASEKKDDALSDNDLIKIKLNDEILIKNKNKDRKINDLINDNTLIETSYGLEIALSNLNLKSLQPKVLIYNNSIKSFTKRIIENEKKWNLPFFVECFDNEILYNKAIDLKKKCIFKSYNPILFKIDSLNLNLIEKECDLVVFLSGGSCISYNDKEMNILPSLTLKKMKDDNQTSLDNLIKLSSFVKKDGYLLFYSDSVIYEQSLFVKDEFLNKYQTKFEFVCGRYILPNESDSRSCYYCIFRRRK